MPTKSYKAMGYVPTSARSGNEYPSLFRGYNIFLRGRGANKYLECAAPPLDLGETIASDVITGTITFTTSSSTISGTGTSFFDELHPYQRIETLLGEIIVVQEILSDTSFIAVAAPLTNGTTVAAYRLPILFELDKQRGTLLTGNALQFDKGNIVCVGSGTLRKNGSVLAGVSLVASRSAKIALYNGTTAQYTVHTLTFGADPVGITVSATAAPANSTYTDANVTTGVGTSNIAIAAHGWQTGQQIRVSTSGTLAAPLVATAIYYVIRVDANNIQLATSLGNAYAGTEINFTTTGSGTTNVTVISKVMPAGDRSLLIAKANTKLSPFAYGNPGEKILLSAALTAGQQIKIDFPAMDSNTDSTSLHTAWRVYASLYGGSTTNSTANAQSGAWYWVRDITSDELGTTAAASYYLEYLDAEIFGSLRIATFDNDTPCDAEGIGTAAGYPVLISCQGKSTPTKTSGTSPGASIVPFKVSNVAAAPLGLDNGQRNEVPTSPPEIIIGFYMAAGRIYLMTANTLQIAIFTADNDFPVATRPFWKSGFKNPYALCFVNGRLYGFTSSGAVRSVADGEEGSEEHGFAADVEEIMKDWKPENVMVVHDPVNECICYINSAAYKNAQGFWVTEIVPFMLRNESRDSESWSPEYIISSTTQDRIVTGAATVNSKMEFLCGGRDGAGAIVIKTYRFDAGTGSIAWQAAWQFSDDGIEDRPKRIKFPTVRGKLTSANLGIHGAASGEEIDVAILEAGNSGSKSGAISLTNSTGVVIRPRLDVAVNNQMQYTVEVAGTWDGTGIRDRVDEVILEVEVAGSRK